MVETASSQAIIAVDTIRDGIVVLKGGSMRAILETDGINFVLKSPEEQQSIISAFQDLLTSADFPVQLMVHSQHANLDSYIASIQDLRTQEQNELLKAQIDDYAKFLASFTEQYNVMAKKFLVVVPYDAPITGSSLVGSLTGSSKPQAKKLSLTEEEFVRGAGQLQTRIAMVSNALSRAGLEIAQLDTEALVELFYNLYNPQEKEVRRKI